MKKQYFKIRYKEHPKGELKTKTVNAYSEEDAKLKIKFENEVTHNLIEFK